MILTDEQADELRFLRVEQILDLVPVSRSTLYRMVNKGEFPPPQRLGASSVWPYHKVREWAKRMGGEPPKRSVDDDDLI